MILEDYWKPIHNFSTADEVLFAFRDAIAGHQNLWNANILHRDITLNNILIGLPGSTEGSRGVIIDFDMAIWPTRTMSLAEVDFPTGTRAFQSVVALMSTVIATKSHRLCYDHLDDLESFFYVLCWICFGHSGSREKVYPWPITLQNWESAAPQTAAHLKASVFSMNLHWAGICTPFFGDIFQDLLKDLQRFFLQHVNRKLDSVPPPNAPPTDRSTLPSLPEVIPESSQHYATILGFIDNAIRKRAALLRKSVAAEPVQAIAAPSTSRSPPSTPPRNTSSLPPRTPLNERLPNIPGSHTIRKRNSDIAALEEDSPSKSKKQRQLHKQRPHAPLRPSSLSLEDDCE
ncbi:hypothetical protein M413DRAFT_113979 [Hebeloma cylindrosporum]|uniref:Fungal-type protein kinase domain-containing protein n=1 Tax=Hebeloma cylindrosporum TaxID=76867 RepID=A0A0C3CLW2_HEBCY|nr:hypothetical protein M413DRAFT_113979 [Hebeloma cylindrosporum h7]